MTEEIRNQGAQPGNSNTKKRGFYSMRFSTEEIERLERHDPFSIESELQILRIYISRLTTLIPEGKLGEEDLKALNTLASLMQSLALLLKTRAPTKTKKRRPPITIEEALAEWRAQKRSEHSQTD